MASSFTRSIQHTPIHTHTAHTHDNDNFLKKITILNILIREDKAVEREKEERIMKSIHYESRVGGTGTVGQEEGNQ